MKKILPLILFTFLFSGTILAQGGTGCWREISAGQNFSLAIKMDGTLWGWGLNGNLLGLNGITPNQNLPVQIGTANDWATVSAGNVHSLAVKTNGTLWSWGNGQFGQLGNNLFNSATWTVTQIGTATDWLTVSAGNRFSLAIKTTGTLWSWGLNNLGQLGDNTIVDKSLPVQVGTAVDWLRIDAGNQHSLGVKTTGTLWAWGNNASGEFGNGTNTNSLFPIQVGTLSNWTLVSAGFDHSMALNSSNNLFTFGNNNNGQLCNGNNTASNVPVPIGFGSDGTVSFYIAISAGNTFSLAVKNDNTLWSSGLNTTGQLGLGNNTTVNALNQVGTSSTWNLISAGDVHSLAMEISTPLWSTGRNLEGQLAVGNFIFSYNLLQSVACPATPLKTNDISQGNLKATIYPNPSNGIVDFNYTLDNPSKVEIQITNIQGQVISKIKLDKSGGLQTETLDLTNQSGGLYFITIKSESNSSTIKLVKQ